MVVKRWALVLLAGGLVAGLSACGQQPTAEQLQAQTAVTGEVDVRGTLAVFHTASYQQRVHKTATLSSVDATSGSAELRYTLDVENVKTADDYAAVASVTVANGLTSEITVDLHGQLYCDDGSHGEGAPVPDSAYGVSGVTIAAGASHTFGPFPSTGGYDVTSCGGAVVSDVVVSKTDSDPAVTLNTRDPVWVYSTVEDPVVEGAVLVDAETIPDGYSVASADLTLNGEAVATTALPGASTYTLTTAADAQPGSYTLVKQITRGGSLPCSPATVVNTASMVDAAGSTVGPTSQASIDLTCTPPPALVCTGTVGYWKGHDWPAGLDPDAPFYDAEHASGFTWRGILDEPVKGRPYVQLAYQYVAARLNVQADPAAAPADVQAALASADEYFATHSIDSKEDRSDAISNAGILQDFNAGYDGIPHC